MHAILKRVGKLQGIIFSRQDVCSFRLMPVGESRIFLRIQTSNY